MSWSQIDQIRRNGLAFDSSDSRPLGKHPFQPLEATSHQQFCIVYFTSLAAQLVKNSFLFIAFAFSIALQFSHCRRVYCCVFCNLFWWNSVCFGGLQHFCDTLLYFLVEFSELCLNELKVLCLNELKVLGAMSSAIPSGQRGRVTIMGFNCFRISNAHSTEKYTKKRAIQSAQNCTWQNVFWTMGESLRFNWFLLHHHFPVPLANRLAPLQLNWSEMSLGQLVAKVALTIWFGTRPKIRTSMRGRLSRILLFLCPNLQDSLDNLHYNHHGFWSPIRGDKGPMQGFAGFINRS